MERNKLSFNKKGQAVIWIIVVLAGLALVALLFLFRTGPKPVSPSEGFNVEDYIKKCVENSVQDTITEILPHGGFMENRKYKVYNNISIEYLCFNPGNFKPCINQRPGYFNQVNEEIRLELEKDMDRCFKNLEAEVIGNGDEISLNNTELKADIVPGFIVTKISKGIIVTSKGASKQYSQFEIKVPSPAYDLFRTALEIVNSEATYCYFEYVGYMLLNQNLKIKIKFLGDSTKIYTIEDIKTGYELDIAVRGCAIPPGI